MKNLNGELQGSPDIERIDRLPVQTGIFALTGEYWTIVYGGRSCSFKNLDGFGYLQRLLQYPGEEFHSLDLLRGPGEHQEFVPRRPSDLGAVLDPRAKQDFKRRLDELREQLDELQEKGAAERAEEVQAEIEAISRELARALGLGGRDRRAGSEAERARINVTRAIRAAIQRIAEHHQALGELLEQSVRTGSYCRYQSNVPIEWSFAADEVDVLAPAAAASAPAAKIESEQSGEVRQPQDRTVFVGRAAERATLRKRLQQAMNGESGVVLISGPPGIGKTRLSNETSAEAQRLGFWTYAGNCYNREDSVPLIPFVEMLELALTRASSLESFRANLGDGAAEFARLMPQLRQLFSDIPPAIEGSPEQTRRALFNAIVDLIIRRARVAPVLMLFEDIHWADAGTLALLTHLARTIIKARVMIMATYRNDEIDPASPLAQTLDELTRLRVEQIHLSGLPQTAVGEMLEALSGRRPSPALVDLFYANTDGNPFFVEELFSHIERTRAERRTIDEADPVQLDLPDSLRLMIRRRLLRVSPETRKILATAAVIGRSFTFMLFEAATRVAADQLVELVEEAEKAGVISSRLRYPDVQFKFTHELIRRAVIDDLSIARRQRLHLCVAEAIEALYPDSLADHAEDLAHHLWNAGMAAADTSKTIRYLQIAGMKAVQTAANVEAIGHFRKALQLVNSAPDSPERAQTELMLQVTLSVPLFTTKGFASPEVEAIYARVRHLSQQMGEGPELFPVTWARWLFHTARAEHITSRDLAEQCLRMAEQTGNPALLLAAHHALGVSLSTLAEFESAVEHLEQTIKLYHPAEHAGLAFQFGQDFGVVARSHAAIDLWYLGYPERALKVTDEALALARKLSHPHSLAAALVQVAWVQVMSRDIRAAEELSEEALKISSEGDFGYWQPIANVFHGWAVAQGTGTAEGIAQMEEGLAVYRASGAGVMRPAFLGLLAKAYSKAGQPTKGLGLLRDAYAVVKQSGERWWEPELYRLEGELTLRLAGPQRAPASDERRAEECFRQALEIAHGQSARLLELRAAVSLGRLWTSQGKRAEARQLVQERYDWFSEGFTTADLVDAAKMIGGRPASRVA